MDSALLVFSSLCHGRLSGRRASPPQLFHGPDSTPQGFPAKPEPKTSFTLPCSVEPAGESFSPAPRPYVI